jgi:hypothetical protein
MRQIKLDRRFLNGFTKAGNAVRRVAGADGLLPGFRNGNACPFVQNPLDPRIAPSSGSPSCTLTAIAMGLRLADHLQAKND